MSYTDINTLNKKKPMYLDSSSENTIFGRIYERQSLDSKGTSSKYKFELKGQSQLKGQGYKYNTGPVQNNEAYRKIWKAIHYIAIFYKPFPGEEKETKEAFISFINCIAELLPDESYSRHVKDFINKNQLTNLNTPIERFKWTYKLHSYINFFRFMKNLKSFLLYFNKNEVERILYNYCKSLELNGYQRDNCIKYVNSQIELITSSSKHIDSNTFNKLENEFPVDISITNISYEEALGIYTISDNNIITKNDWGPTVWMMIHFFAYNLKKNNIPVYFKFIMSLTYLLPCEECKKHMRNNLRIIPLVIDRNSNNQSIFDWSFRFHNAINSQTGKKQLIDKKPIENMYKDVIVQNYEYI
jgi:hypothetical protein